MEKQLSLLPTNVNPRIANTMRDAPPEHYTFIIDSFSLLLDALGVNEFRDGLANFRGYNTSEFETGGYKWRLSLYPNGDLRVREREHISLYLVILDTDDFPLGWEVKVSFKLFVYNHIQDKYLTVQDSNGSPGRFHGMKTELGFTQLLPISTFIDASNGYLVNDSCAFGAELMIHKGVGPREIFSITECRYNSTYTWKIDNFSSLSIKSLCSDTFTVGDMKWCIKLYSEGKFKGRDTFIPLLLYLADVTALHSGKEVFVSYCLRVHNQLNWSKCYRHSGKSWLSLSRRTFCGVLESLALEDINDTSKGFKVNGTVIIEADIEAISMAKYFPGK